MKETIVIYPLRNARLPLNGKPFQIGQRNVSFFHKSILDTSNFMIFKEENNVIYLGLEFFNTLEPRQFLVLWKASHSEETNNVIAHLEATAINFLSSEQQLPQNSKNPWKTFEYLNIHKIHAEFTTPISECLGHLEQLFQTRWREYLVMLNPSRTKVLFTPKDSIYHSTDAINEIDISDIAELLLLTCLNIGYQIQTRSYIDELGQLLKGLKYGDIPSQSRVDQLDLFRRKVWHFQSLLYFENPIKRNRAKLYALADQMEKTFETRRVNREFLQQLDSVAPLLKDAYDRKAALEKAAKIQLENQKNETERARHERIECEQQQEKEEQKQKEEKRNHTQNLRFTIAGIGLALISILGSKPDDYLEWFSIKGFGIIVCFAVLCALIFHYRKFVKKIWQNFS